MTTDFEVSLISNASMNLFPDNSMASFWNVLSEPLNLKGQWVVALVDLTFPATIQNVEDTVVTLVSRSETIEIKIPGGLYRCAQDIVSEIKNRLAGHDDPIGDYKIDDKTMKGMVTLSTDTDIHFNPSSIPQILGYPDEGILYYKHGRPTVLPDRIISTLKLPKYPIDITCGRHLMFVYISIITHQHVGDTFEKVLRIVPLPQKLRNCELYEATTVNYRAFEHLQFKNLVSNRISRIKIELRDEAGRLIPFMGTGRTVATLHFRKQDS